MGKGILSVLISFTLVAGSCPSLAFAQGTGLAAGRLAIEGSTGAIPLGDTTIAPIPSQTITGTSVEPDITVKYAGVALDSSVDYRVVRYEDNTKVGTAKVVLEGLGFFEGTAEQTFTIVPLAVSPTPVPGRWANPFTVKAGKAKTVKAERLKMGKRTVKNAIVVKDAQGRVSYVKEQKGSSDALSINRKSGVVAVQRGTKKGTYRLKVKVSAAGNASYIPATETVTVKVSVR